MRSARTVARNHRLRLEQLVAELGASLLSAPANSAPAIVERALGDMLAVLRIDCAQLGELRAPGQRIRVVAGAARPGCRLAPWPSWPDLPEALRFAAAIGRCCPGRPIASGALPARAAGSLPHAYLLVATRLPDAGDGLLLLGSDCAVAWPEERVPRLQLLARVALSGLQRRRELPRAAGLSSVMDGRRGREVAALRMIRFPTLGVEGIGRTSSSRRPSLRWVMGSSKPIL